MEIELFVFPVKASQFSKFNENKFKPNITNSVLTERGLTVTFKVKNSLKLRKKSTSNFANVLF